MESKTSMKVLIPYAIASFLILGLNQQASGELDDFEVMDAEFTAEMRKLGFDADMWLRHSDYKAEEDAPIIQGIVMDLETDGPEQVGSYKDLRDAVRGKNEIEVKLYLQFWLETYQQTEAIAAEFVEGFNFWDEYSTFLVVSYYLDTDNKVTQQFQLLQWNQTETKKCVFSSEISLRLSPYYQDSITGAMAELLTYCAAAG